MVYTGLVTLSPSRKALVCGVGEPVELTCNTTETFLRWQITIPGGAETSTRTETRLLSYNTPSASPLMVYSAMINFTRTSSHEILPLISTLVIDHVTEGLNGTVVSCMEVSSSQTATSAATIVHIIDPEFGKLSNY